MERRRHKTGRFTFKLTAFILAAIILLTVCFYKMRPLIITYAESVAETILLDSANDAVVAILEEQGVSYNDMVTLTRNEAGQVTSLETDVVKVNSLKSLVSNRLSSLISEREYYELNIPAGTFLSNIYTNGLGPEVHFKMQLTATARVTFSHEFKSAGINQVLHIISVDMDIRGSLIVAGYKDGVSVATSAMAAQTVIVGITPEAFTQVIESENDNTAGLINDYGAVAGE